MKLGVVVESALLAVISCSAAGLVFLSSQTQAAEVSTEKTDFSNYSKNENNFSLAEKNKISGLRFFELNKSKPGVVSLVDGLQYKILVPGKGPLPTANDIVTVHYSGRLINGKEFDSSYKHGQPLSFPLSGVIPGWVEALKLMPVGSTWEVYIPAHLAYGENGAPPAIGPNESLIFTIELIASKPNSV